MTQRTRPDAQPLQRRVVMIVMLLLLAACGAKKDTSASQTAARVNKDEITVHQINFVLQQQRGLRPEEVDAASALILERLIDQQLLVRKADALNLARDPRVLQQIEAGRADILARAAIERLGDTAAKPTPDEIKTYFDSRPSLFSDRRVYNLQEINVEAKPDQIPALRTALAAAKGTPEFIDYLKANSLRFAVDQAVRAAEQLPQDRLEAISRLKDGQSMLNQGPRGVQVLVLAGARSHPVTEEQARPAIEQYLLNERKRKLVEDEIKLLRADAKIDYVGKFVASASAAGSAPSAVTPAAPVAAPVAPPPVAAPKAAASTALSAADISKGMGLK